MKMEYFIVEGFSMDDKRFLWRDAVKVNSEEFFITLMNQSQDQLLHALISLEKEEKFILKTKGNSYLMFAKNDVGRRLH